MIGIDMEMPESCDECILADKIGQYFGCPVLNKAIPIGHKSNNCPLHPLDDEIRIGDEVKVKQITGVVVKIDKHGVHCIDERGNGLRFEVNDMTRTGRHFDEVETLLKKMKGKEK